MKIDGITFHRVNWVSLNRWRARSRKFVLDLIPAETEKLWTAVLYLHGKKWQDGAVMAKGKSRTEALHNLQYVSGEFNVMLQGQYRSSAGWTKLKTMVVGVPGAESLSTTDAIDYVDDFGFVAASISYNSNIKVWRVWVHHDYKGSDEADTMQFKSERSAKRWVEATLHSDELKEDISHLTKVKK